jgi:isopenicillin N synthase-like dioxygenase
MNNDNIWPARPDGFRAACTAYYRALAGISSTIVNAIALSLDLDRPALPYWTTRQFSSLVLNHYPGGLPPEAQGAQQDRLVPHTDHGGITLLALDGRPGLEVMIPGRGWCPVSVGGQLLLLAGEMLQKWSGGRLPATVHRVTEPVGSAGGTGSRITLVFFHNPSPDAPMRLTPEAGDHPAAAGDLFIEQEMAYQQSLADGRVENTFDRQPGEKP